AGGGAVPSSAGRRSLFGQALYDTFGQAGARAGAAWIGVLVVLGVFAPFLASSHPLLYRLKGGGLSSPLLRHLGPLDVALVVLFFHAAVVLARRPGAGRAVGLIAWPAAVAAWAVAAWAVVPGAVRLAWYRPVWATESAGGWLWVVAINVVAAAALLGAGWLLGRGTVALYRSAAAGGRRRLFASAVGAAGLCVVAAFAVSPPPNPIYESYRQAEQRGEVDLVVRTLVPYSPNDRLRDRPIEEALTPPGRTYWLGTTQYREDMLSRLVHACRVALSIGLIATGIGTTIGVTVGGAMGYFAGRLDLLGMRVLEIVEAIPTLILLLIVTVSFGRSLYLMMVVIGLLTWTSDARFVRAEFFRLRNQDFVAAATAAGLARRTIIFRHMLPNGIAPVLVNASFGIAGAILLESTLSFLGLGLGPDDPSWGQLLEQARSGGTGFSWWVATFPGLAIFLTVFAYVLIGEAVRDAIDPKLKKAA
ncbi:MAG: transporter permease, partial [Phycisphaerales bacterium]|nr:transporter permease [Phycisphaerales bacterium]